MWDDRREPGGAAALEPRSGSETTGGDDHEEENGEDEDDNDDDDEEDASLPSRAAQRIAGERSSVDLHERRRKGEIRGFRPDEACTSLALETTWRRERKR